MPELQVCVTDENVCNWMMFVHRAKEPDEQNLEVIEEHDGSILFCATKDIDPNEELKIDYSRVYGEKYGGLILKKKPASAVQRSTVNELEVGKANNNQEEYYSCETCPVNFNTQNLLSLHSVLHGQEAGQPLQPQQAPFACPECQMLVQKM